MLLKKVDYRSAEKIVEWNKNTNIDFLYQWAGKKAYGFPISINQILDRELKDENEILAIIQNNEVVGTVELYWNDRENKTMRFGRLLIDSNYQGKGYGSKAIELIEKKAFNEYGAKCLELGVFEFNKKAKLLYERLGYSVTEIKENPDDLKWSSYTMVKRR